jgi:hypothetical protein
VSSSRVGTANPDLAERENTSHAEKVATSKVCDERDRKPRGEFRGGRDSRGPREFRGNREPRIPKKEEE